MTELTTKRRNRLPDKDFGLPEQRKFPEEDKAHARNAKARASEEYHEGHITKAEEERVDRKSDRKLHGLKEHQLPHWKEK